jgi:hypothetical protein
LKLAESVAGPVTARILADHFERVILIDPEINDNEKPKTRIMQYNAGHCEIARSLSHKSVNAFLQFSSVSFSTARDACGLILTMNSWLPVVGT